MAHDVIIMNEILFTGKVLSGKESFELTLINRLSNDAKGDAYELAEQIANQHPVAVRTMLKVRVWVWCLLLGYYCVEIVSRANFCRRSGRNRMSDLKLPCSARRSLKPVSNTMI